MFKEILLFLSGVAAGALIGMRVLEKKYGDKFEEEVNRRIDEIEAEKAEEKKEKEAEKSEMTRKDKMQYNRLANNYKEEKLRKEVDLSEEDEDDDADEAEYEHPDDDEEAADYPYQITEEDWNDNMSGEYDQEELYFYKDGYMLVDDQDNILSDDTADITTMLGDHWLETLSGASRGELYFRNENLRTEYCIVINDGAYPLK